MEQFEAARKPGLVAIAVLLALTCGTASASITQVVAFGDSLSDTGNVFSVTGYPPAPYWNGRQSDGPVGVEYMAQRLGAGLTNLAWNGATTGAGNVVDGGNAETAVALPGMTTVFNSALGAGQIPIDPLAVYVVWGGPNDFLSITGPGDVPPVIARALTNLVTIVATLQFAGATNIIVPGMPDLALTPRIAAMDAVYPGTAMLMHAASMNFNVGLSASLPPGVRFVDTNRILLDIYMNPSMYGLTNVTSACFDGASVCSSPGEYLFWDGIHPTTAVHAVMGEALAQAAVPEPCTFVIVGSSLLFAGVVRRKPEAA